MYIGGKKKHQLVTAGPFSVSRNPLYLFSVTGAFGIGLTDGSILAGVAVGSFVFLIFSWVIPKEEDYLLKNYGSSYRHYMQTTPRWLIRVKNWRDVEKMEIYPRLVLHTLRDTGIMLVAIPFLEGVEILQQWGYLPVLFHIP